MKKDTVQAVKYRSRTDIIATILKSAVDGATKTRIMYGAYLSYAQVKEYLAFLSEKKLISYDQGTGLYKLTETGVKLLRTYEGISELISIDDAKGSRTP